MDADGKRRWLHFAEVFDSLRVFPRLILVAYGGFVYHITEYLMVWYTHEPAESRGNQESATVAAIFATVTGLASWVFKVYSDNGRDWSDRDETTATTTTTTSTTPK